MGKLTGVLAGSAILLIFSYYVLSNSFTPLINWIGPILGYRLNLLLGLLWLEQGTPLQYASIFAIWAVVGIVVGFSSKRIRSVFTTATTVWLALGIISALSLAAIALGFITNSRTLSLSSVAGLVTVPPGSNIYAILHEPVIVRYYSYFLSLFTSGTFSSLASTSSKALATQRYERVIENIILFLIAGPLEAYIIMVATGIAVLFLKNRFIGPKKEKKVKRKEEKVIATLLIILLLASSSSIIANEKVNGGPLSADASTSIQEMNGVSNILSHFYSSGIGGEVGPILAAVERDLGGDNAHPSAMQPPSIAPPSSPQLSIGNLSGGAGISVVSGNGNLFNVYGLLNYSSAPSGSFSLPAFSNSEFSIAILQSNIYQMVESVVSSSTSSRSQLGNPLLNVTGLGNNSINYLGLINLLPNFLYIVAYNGSLSSTRNYASAASSYLASELGITVWSQLISINTNSFSSLSSSHAATGPGLSLYLYSGYVIFHNSAVKFSNNILGQISNNANENLLKESINSGYLIPGANNKSATSSLILEGQINSRAISGLLNSTSYKNYSSLSRTGVFALDLSFWNHRFLSGGSHNINGAQLFNYNGPLNVSQTGGFSVFGFGASSSPSLNFTSPFSGLKLNIFINNESLASTFRKTGNNSSNISVTAIPSGSFYLNQYSATTDTIFPANLTESVQERAVGGNTFNLKFTFWNNDTQPVTGINVSLEQFFSTYGGTLKVDNNFPAIVLISSLGPGQHYSFSYEVTVFGTGNYIIPPAQVSYQYDGQTFNSQVGASESFSGQAPSVAYAVTSSIVSVIGFLKPLKPLASFHLGALNIVELVILLLIVLDVYIEYRAFKKWREAKKLPVVQQEIKQ